MRDVAAACGVAGSVVCWCLLFGCCCWCWRWCLFACLAVAGVGCCFLFVPLLVSLSVDCCRLSDVGVIVVVVWC